MKQKRNFCKRLLTFVLCIAMVFTSVNIPAFTVRAEVTNEYAAPSSGTHGATYDDSTGKITFFVNSEDAIYENAGLMWYKEYGSYEEASKNHISKNNGDFINGVDALTLKENDEKTKKLYEATVSEGTGAILYYFNPPNQPRPDYEHIIVIDENATSGGDTTDPITVNKSALQTAYTNAESTYGIEESSTTYTSETWAAYIEAMKTAGEVLAKTDATADEVSNAKTALDTAIEGLTEISGNEDDDAVATTEDKKALQDLYDTEKETVDAGNGDGVYTAESWKTYADAVAAAGEVLADESATVKAVNDALKALEKAKKGLVKESGNDSTTPVEGAIDLEAKSKQGIGELGDLTAGIGMWNNDAVDAKWEYNGTEATLTASAWTQIDWWGIQWAINGIEVTPGEWTVEFDIVSTIDKTAYFKVTRFDAGEDNDAVIAEMEKEAGNAPWGWSLTANKPEHVKLTGTVDVTGKVRFFFNLAGGTGAGSVTISNVTWTQTPGSEKEKAPALTTDKVSKQNGYKVGESPVLTFTDDEAWRTAVKSVKVSNMTAASDKYTLAEGKLTLDASLFGKQNVYKIEVEADGYEKATFMLPVYDASVASESWKQEWADEFDGTELDPAKWDYEIGVKSGDDATSDAPVYWGNNEKQYYTKEAVEVKDGKLVITANELTDELKSKYNITDTQVKYSSARIRTVSEDGSNTLFGTTYGRIEAAMELPYATGYWPAFWMLPTNETIDIYGTWAASGELDIMEAGQTPNTVDGTIHYGSVWPGNVYSGGHYTFPEEGATGNAHVYAVEWEPGEIRWYADDILYHVENNWYAKGEGASSNYAYPAPFDEDFYILFNLAVGGNYIGNKEPTELNQSMKVDYVRVLKDESKDYGTAPDAPGVDRDSEFFEANKQYADENGNYLKDAPFDTLKDHQMGDGATVVPGLGYWSSATNTGNGAATDIDVVEKDGVKYAKIDVKQTGANNYDVQLIQHVPLAKGYTYKLTFDAYTDVAGGRNFSVAPKGDGDNGWAGYDSGITANLTAEVQSFEHIFTMAKDSDPTARIEMNIGNAMGTVYVGNAKLVVLTDQEVEDIENEKLNGKKTPLDNGEHIYNGGFDQGTGRFVYWNKVGDYTVDTSKRSMKATINASTTIDDTALTEPGIQLLKGDDYKLTLQAKADAPKDIKVGLYSKDGKAYAEKTYSLTTDMTELTLEFTMDKEVTDEEAVLIIAFGGNTTSVEIDNVSMKRTSNRNVEWNESVLYPLGGETWSDYTYHVNGINTPKTVPADGIITEALKPSTNNYDYMIFRNVSVKKGYTYDLSFDIKTSVADQKITASVQQDQTWITMTEETVTTTTEWQTVKKTFTAGTEGAIDLKFLISASTNTDCNVSLQNVTLNVVGGPYLVLNRVPREMLVGATLQLDVAHAIEVNPDYEVYTYTSSNDSVATVSASGLITAVETGSATITVKSGAGATKSVTINVVSELTKGDKTELNELITAYNEYKEADYTPETWEAFAKALEAAKIVADNPDATQNDVDAALEDLKKAVATLKKADGSGDTEVPGKDKLNASIAKYENGEQYKEADYTKESWADFAEALAVAKAVAAKVDATQQEIDDALADLEAAAAALVKVKEGLWIADIPVQTYTGSAIKPAVRVYDGATLLTEKTDYTVSYKNNTNKGTADVTIKGKGNYAKTYTAHFEIAAKNIADADLTAAGVYAVINKTSGKVKDPKVTVKYGKKTLNAAKGTKENDYTIAYPNVNGADEKAVAGSYTITITGHGNYEGTREISYNVVSSDAINMSKVKVNLNKNTVDYADGGATERPAVDSVTYGKGENQITLTDEDYDVSYVNADSVGKAAVVVTAKGIKYYGSKSTTYTVTGTDFKEKDFDVQGISTDGYTYTGSEITVDGLKVYDKKRSAAEGSGQYELVLGQDYNVTYSKNVNVGKATITLTGMGRYTGKFTTKFQINKMDLGLKNTDGSGLVWTCETSAVHTKSKAVPKFNLLYNGIPLTEKKDYKVKCTDNAKVTTGSTAKITITGTGNFTGNIEENYAVTTPEASMLYVADVKIPKLNKLKNSVKVYEASTGKALKAGTDYDKNSIVCYVPDTTAENGRRDVAETDLVAEAVLHAEVTLKGNYASSEANAVNVIDFAFRLYDKAASKLTVDKISTQAYTGKEVMPEVKVYADNAKTQKLTEGVDYTVEYSNNIKKGTAKAVITGIGNGYGGTKTVTFKIGTRNLDIETNWAAKAAESIRNFFKNLF